MPEPKPNEQVTLTIPLWLWDAMSKAYYAQALGKCVETPTRPELPPQRLNDPELIEEVGGPLYGLKDVQVVSQRGPVGWIPRGMAAEPSAKDVD